MSRAIGIFSGGLDSMLAVEVLRKQGVEILAITFETPFFGSLRARESARVLDVQHRVVDITDQHLEIVRNPIFGLGRNMNPCMDCHALMFSEAAKILESEGYDFLFSGEVLGQRPFSQNRQALLKVAQASGRPELILRPLSALRLPETEVERKGLVDRRELLGLNGRSRKPQMDLARRWGITGYPSPAGGCLLTDVSFSRRLRDLFENESFWDIRDVRLLSICRHLRILPDKKVVVGRNQEENERLLSLAGQGDVLLSALEHPGPLVLVPHGGSDALILEAAAVCLRYGDAPVDSAQEVRVIEGSRERLISARAADPRDTEKWII